MNEYFYHIDQHDGFTFLCLANPGSSAKVAFAMLSRMGTAFVEQHAEQGQTAHAYSLESSFGPVLRREMTWANQATNDSALVRAQAQVNEVKEVMVENIEKVLQRGDRIDLLVDKADALELEAGRFQKNATKLKKRMWWKNFKCKLLMIFLVLLALLLIILAATGNLGGKKK
jgi:vesicle-associated membrane protein 7